MSEVDNSYLIDLYHVNGMKTTANGDILTNSGINNVKQWVINTLMTVKGSLAHRPDWGIGLKLWVNKLESLQNQQNFALTVKQEIEKDARIQEVSGVSITKENNLFVITVSIIIVSYGSINIEARTDGNTTTFR